MCIIFLYMSETVEKFLYYIAIYICLLVCLSLNYFLRVTNDLYLLLRI